MSDVVIGKRALAEAAKFVDWLVLQGLPRDIASQGVKAFVTKVAGKKVLTKPDIAGSGNETRAVLQKYIALYLALNKEEPLVTSIDAIQLAGLTKKYGRVLVETRLTVFAQCDDPFIRKLPFTIANVHRQWNALPMIERKMQAQVTYQAAPADCTHAPRCKTALQCSEQQMRDLRNGVQAVQSVAARSA